MAVSGQKVVFTTTLHLDVVQALDKFKRDTGDDKTDIVDRALRKELGMLPQAVGSGG